MGTEAHLVGGHTIQVAFRVISYILEHKYRSILLFQSCGWGKNKGKFPRWSDVFPTSLGPHGILIEGQEPGPHPSERLHPSLALAASLTHSLSLSSHLQVPSGILSLSEAVLDPPGFLIIVTFCPTIFPLYLLSHISFLSSRYCSRLLCYICSHDLQ